jgi:hypothetical protein
MKRATRIIKLSAIDVENIINDLSLLIVSLDRMGSEYHDKPRLLALETDKFMRKVNAFKLLAQARGVLTEAFNKQTSAGEVARSENDTEALPYWVPKERARET